MLYINDSSADFGKNADITVQFAPFQLNRKSLLTKLYASLERTALAAENFVRTSGLLTSAEKYINELADDMPFEINCQKVSAGALIRAFAPEFEEDGITPLEKIFSYMELVRELDRDKLFVMVNMRSYFSDEDMERFVQSVCLHDFKVLLLESTSRKKLKNVKRYTIDEDLCEF